MFGRQKRKPVELEILEELRALDPARSFQDWEDWLRIVEPGKYLDGLGAKSKFNQGKSKNRRQAAPH